VNEFVKMQGRVLVTNKVSKNRTMFSENCKITYPEVIPVAYGFDFFKPDMVVGYSSVSKDERGLIADAYINNNDFIKFVTELGGEIPIGGYFTRVKKQPEDEHGVVVIDEARLSGIGITLAPADDECKLVLVEPEGEEL
jgi:hypothetical protein